MSQENRVQDLLLNTTTGVLLIGRRLERPEAKNSASCQLNDSNFDLPAPYWLKSPLTSDELETTIRHGTKKKMRKM